MVGLKVGFISYICVITLLAASVASGVPSSPALPDDRVSGIGPRSVVDDSQKLFVPEGEFYELCGRHVYASAVEINGTLAVIPYDGANSSAGTLDIEAPAIYIGPNGRILADGRGYGGGGGATEDMADVGGGGAGSGGKGGIGDSSPSGFSECGGGGGGSAGGPGGKGGYPGRDGSGATPDAGGKGGDYFNGYTGDYGGGDGGTGYGGGGGGGAGHWGGGGGGGGGGSGGKNASGQTGGDGAGPARGNAGRSQTYPGPESDGGDGGYAVPGQNGDSSIDEAVEMGSGGGGGGTGALNSGGGGGGGAGGGAIKLIAFDNLTVLGGISANGAGGGGGGLEPGRGFGGDGGGGGGGGILLKCQNLTMLGALDSRGRRNDTLTEENGGTVKIIYTRAFLSGSLVAGRAYANGRPLMQGLLFPENDTGTVDMPFFKWKKAADPDGDAVSYQLQVANDSGFGSPWVDLSGISEPQALPPFALSGGMLFWRVRAYDDFGPGPWSETGRFSIDSVPPVSRVDPLPEFVNRTDVKVTWNGTDGQTGIANYTIYLSVDGADYQVWQDRTNRTEAVLLGDDGHSYRFYSLAQDWARNREGQKTGPEAFTTVDTVPPESVLGSLPIYVPGPDFTVTWTGSDGTSGIAGYDVFVSEDIGPFEAWVSGISGNSAIFHGLEGHRYTFYVVAADRAGNVEDAPLPEEFATTRVDGSAPVTTLVIGTPRCGAEPVFVGPTTTFELKATDNYSGTDGIFFGVDDRPAGEYNGTFTEAVPGFHNLTYWGRDAAGNVEAPHVFGFFVDAGPPRTDLGFDGSYFTAGNLTYISGATRILLSAADNGSGVLKTNYRIDGVDGGSYSGPFPLGKHGSHLLIFHSVDNLGLSEPEQAYTIVVDLYPPVTKATAPSTVSNRDVEVAFAATDADSGTAGIYYRIARKGVQPGDFRPGVKVVLAAPADHSLDGTYLVEYYSVDRVGNRETARTLEITIDTRCELELLFKDGLSVDESPFEVRGASEHRATVFINGRQVDVNPNGNFTLALDLKPGRNRITVSATDLAGNTATETGYVSLNGPSGGLDLMALVLLLSAVVIIIVVLAARLRRRKRPEEEYEMF